MSGRLDGKVCVITGTGSGMGEAAAWRFAMEGAKVVGLEMRKEMNEELAKKITAAGGVFIPYHGVVEKRECTDEAIDLALEKFGKVDVVYLNAGRPDSDFTAHNTTDEFWDMILGMDLYGYFYGIRKSVEVMLKQGFGSIIVTASVCSFHGGIAGAAYTTCKHAVAAMINNTAIMYGPKGIRINGICPGGINSELAKGKHFDVVGHPGNDMLWKLQELANGLGECEESANCALFYASDESKFVNGSFLQLDGGWCSF